MKNIKENVSEYLEKKRELESLISNIERLDKKYSSWVGKIGRKKEIIDEIEEQKRRFSTLDRILKRRNYRSASSKIRELEEEILNINNEIHQFEEEEISLEQLETRSQSLRSQQGILTNWISQQEAMNGFSFDENGMLHFYQNDENSSFFQDKRKGTSLNMNNGDSLDAYALVHCTSFIPYDGKILNNYDGKKPTFNEYDYHDFIVESFDYQQRITTHFTLNGKVGDNDGGTWENSQIMIIEPLTKQYNNVCNLFSGDTWIRASVELSDEAVIMFPSSMASKIDYNRIPNKIIIYDGNPVKALDAVLYNLGYKPQLINGRSWNCGYVQLPLGLNQTSRAHSETLDSELERKLNTRNTALQLIRGNKEEFDPFITQYELLELYDLVNSDVVARFGFPKMDSYNYFPNSYSKMREQVSNKDFFDFFLSIGLVIENDRFRLLNPYEMYDYITKEQFNSEDFERFSQVMTHMLENRPKENNLMVSMNMKISDLTQYSNFEALREINKKFSDCYSNLKNLYPRLIWSTKGLKLGLCLEKNKYDELSFLKSEDLLEESSQLALIKRKVASGDDTLSEAFQLLNQEVKEIETICSSLSEEKANLK